MNISEFDVINKYFNFSCPRDDVDMTVGDDCAMLSIPVGKKLLITTDTLIAGVHFPLNTSAEDIAYKSLMVNLSDLAAMGAQPAWISLAITLPNIDEQWLSSFSQQLSTLLSEFNVSLIGGDTTKGPLSITIHAMGLGKEEKILKRDQAKLGDKIFVTGTLGDAAIGLHALLNDIEDEQLSSCINKLNRPVARVDFAGALTEYSKCAIDISDGLIADLGHIIKASHCGARVSLKQPLLSSVAQYYFRRYHENKIDWSIVLTQGDDYELCFTIDAEDEILVKKLAEKYHLKIFCLGEITDTNKLEVFDFDNKRIEFSDTGFKHF